MNSPQLSSLALAVTLTLAALGCNQGDGSFPPAASIPASQTETAKPAIGDQTTETSLVSREFGEPKLSPTEFRGELYPEVLLKTSKGEIRLRLDAKLAPATVDNFLTNYVATNHYDGTIFHYVQPEMMILGGLFDESMTPRSTRSEIQNEATNGLKNTRGSIAMSRDPNFIHSSTCQFFINCADNASFDHLGPDDSTSFGYCVFGEVIEGMDVVDAISQVDVKSADGFVNLPSEPVSIISAERIK